MELYRSYSQEVELDRPYSQEALKEKLTRSQERYSHGNFRAKGKLEGKETPGAEK